LAIAPRQNRRSVLGMAWFRAEARIKRLRQLEEGNSKLKKLVADLSLDKAILQDVIRRKI